MPQERIGLIAAIALAVLTIVDVPFIYMPGFGNLPKTTVIAAFANCCTATIALIALLVAYRQFRLNRKNQRETTAKTNFRDFLKLCVEHPRLAYGRSAANDPEKYEWFVAHFLWSAEEMLEFAPQEWESNLQLHISYHRDFLQNDPRFRREDLPTYTKTLQDFIDRTIGALPPAEPNVVVGLRLPPETIAAANSWAQQNELFRTEAIEFLVRRGLMS